MKLLIALGNPGVAYVRTRHNAGYLFADDLIENEGFSKKKISKKSELFEGALFSNKLFILKPLTFMNLSGESVIEIMQFFKIPFSHILVVYDDFDIALGELRFREKGSAGTHNGMKSIIASLGTNEFHRIRLGIGPLDRGKNVSDFVLSPFSKEEYAVLTSVFPQVREKILQWLRA